MKAIKAKPFFRGVRLRGRKELSENMSAERPDLAGCEIAIPMKQHVGSPAQPIVSAGERVLRGQPIAVGTGTVCAAVHASVTGTVTAVEERADGRGGRCMFVVIAPDGTDDEAFYPSLEQRDPASILQRIRDCGIVGMGGAGFPSHIKLSPPVPVDTLIVNGAECEPYLTCDDVLMRENRDSIVRGAGYMATALGAQRVLIGIERNKPRAAALFEESGLPVILLKKQYPMGSEKHLIYCCTGRKVAPGKLPADVGAVVQNVATALAVCEAVERGKPLIERVVTLSGDGITTPKNLLCPIGAPLSALANACGGIKETAVKMVAGGPMTGTALTGTNAVVTKTTSGFLFMTADETNTQPPTNCINCGRCADVCPMHLMPMQTEFYVNAKEYDKAETYGGVLACIECGACSYICPARRPLAQAIKTAKEQLRRKA